MASGAPGRTGAHDVGGSGWELPEHLDEGDLRKPLDLTDRPVRLWEMETDAILGLLVSAGRIGLDAHRRAVEELPKAAQERLPYYGKWAAAMAKQLLERGAITAAQWAAALGPEPSDEEVRFAVGQEVRVRSEDLATRWRRPHLRTPGYVFGARGVVERVCGVFPNPEPRAFPGPDAAPGDAEQPRRAVQPLYRVCFRQRDLWPGCGGPETDTVVVEVYQHWLEPCSGDEEPPPAKRLKAEGRGCAPAQSHAERAGHGHEGHEHEDRAAVEQRAVDSEGPQTAGESIAGALKSVLLAAKVITPEALRAGVERVETMGQKGEGPRIVARAWADQGFKERLLKDATAACAELGITASNNTAPTVMTVLESTDSVHNVVVCTLCSCYPRSILGLSPSWYRCRSYRARMVREPRAVLREFGTDVPDDVEVRVHDSTADLRYMVLPPRPKGTDGWSEERLATLVNRDSMIGVARALCPDGNS